MHRLSRYLDVFIAIMMAGAAVLTAWATYEGSQWDSIAADDRSRSAIMRSDAGRSAAEAVTQSSVDASVWIEWQKAINLGRDDLAVFLRGRFSEALDYAQDDWLSREVLDESGAPIDGVLPKGTPLSLDSYNPPAQIQAGLFAQQAEDKLASADRASDLSGNYVMQAVLLAMVLFFGSAAAKFSNPKLQAVMSVLALAMLITSAARIAALPIA